MILQNCLIKLFLYSISFSILFFSCYPLSVTRAKGRIQWDKELKKGKTTFIEHTKQEKVDQPPNIVVIVADDLSPYEVSAYGVDHIATPHIDQIGKEGVLFKEGYATAPTCAPVSTGIMTGRVQNRYGFETQIMEFYPANMIEYLSGKYFVNTGEFVMKAKPDFPAEWQAQKQGVPPSEINMAEALKTLNYTIGITNGFREESRTNSHTFALTAG